LILAHLADLHLGFSAYDRVVQGRNARTRDVEEAFLKALGQVVSLKPDLVILAGDLLDHPHPDSGVLVALTDGLALLRDGLPDVPVLAVAGERDTPLLRVDPGVLAALDRFPRMEAAGSAPRSIFLRALDAHVLLLPHRAIRQEPYPPVRAEGKAAHNLLVFHGRPGVDEGTPVPIQEWDYVALGSGHRMERVDTRMVDPGSLERVSTDPWSEALEEKGFVTYELGSDEPVFHPVVGRPVVDLAPVIFDPEAPEDVNRRIRDSVGVIPGGIEGKIVRLTIRNLSGSDSSVVDAELVGSLRERALFLQVDFDAPPRERVHVSPESTESPRADGAVRWLTHAAERLESREELVRIILGAVSEDSSSVAPPAEPFSDALRDLLSSAAGPVAVVLDPDAERMGPADRETKSGGRGGGSEFPWRATDGSAGAGPYRGPDRRRGVGRRALSALLTSHGGAELERLAALFSPFGAPVAGGSDRRRAEELAGLEARIEEAELAVRRLPEWQKELRDLRAEAAVVGGDLEASVTEWLRERQDAETHLMAYRDRARELKTRLSQLEDGGEDSECPTCGRPLEGSAEEVAGTLREEWEAVVQDGQWWKRRREQVEFKPEAIRDLESKAHQLHASIEGLAERLEGARVGRRDLEDLKARRDLLRMEIGDRADEADGPLAFPTRGRNGDPDAAPLDIDPRTADEALVVVEEAQRLLDAWGRRELELRASAILNGLTAGRLSGVRVLDREVELLRDGRVSDAQPASSRVLLDLALRLAVARLAVESGSGTGRTFEVGYELERLPGWVQRSVLGSLQELVSAGIPVLLWSEGTLVQSAPEGLALVASVEDRSGTPRQILHSGPPPFLIVDSGDAGRTSKGGSKKSDQLPKRTQASARS
jgi:DNA repair exonuclease SbcCD nuclease subunit